jgi:SAM-dependent methyltransferase
VSGPHALAPLVEAASAYYRGAGRFAWHFARGKLRADPVFAAILAHGLLGGRTRLLDLGCGQGLLAAWLLAAHACYASERRGAWPRGWPAPPELTSYIGIDINPREVARGRHAFALDPGAAVQIVHGDIRDVDYVAADAVVILDVLHYIDYAAQQSVLERARGALTAQGVLLLRIGDAEAGPAHHFSRVFDQTVVLLRRHRWLPLKCRPLGDWQRLLATCGFRARALPLRAGTPFANVLLHAEVA